MNITTSTQFEEWEKCKDDAKYFIEKYITLSKPTGVIPFTLNQSQDDILTRLILGHKKCKEPVNRQEGVTSINIAFIVWKTVFSKHNYHSLVMADNHSSLSYHRNMFSDMFECVPGWIKPEYFSFKDNYHISWDNETSITFRIKSEAKDIIKGLCYHLVYVEESFPVKEEKSDPSTDLFKIVNQYMFEHNDSKTREAIVEEVKQYIFRNVTVRDKTKQEDTILGNIVLGVDVLNISWDITL